MNKWLFKNLILALILAVTMMPGAGMAADVTSQGQASIEWNSIFFSYAVDWYDSAAEDSRGSLSGVSIGLNGQADSSADVMGAKPWGNTSLQRQLTDGSGGVSGYAYTKVSGGALMAPPAPSKTYGPPNPYAQSTQYASSNIELNSFGQGSVDLSQAVLSGQFTVYAPTKLGISATYHLFQYLNTVNDLGAASAFSDVWVSLLLENLDTGESAFDDKRFVNSFEFDAPGTFTLSSSDQDGTLAISMDLTPGTTYHFKAQAGTSGNAATASVPEPISFVLLGGGMIGLATLRKRENKSKPNSCMDWSAHSER